MSEIIDVDKDKNFVSTGKKNNVTGFYIPNFSYTKLGKFIIYRLKEDRDVKILITGKGKSTGTGKTTLAIILAKWINRVRNQIFDQNFVWTSKEYSFMNVWEYLRKYKNANKGDPFITDELEYMADRRRHQTHENIKFSQAWSVLRYKNVITIGTAPGLSDLEKRIPEGADIWINVIMKGMANVYYLTVDDFTWEHIVRRMRLGKYRESIFWDKIEESDDYQWLKKQKEEIGVPGIDDNKNSVSKEDINKKEREVKRNTLENAIITLDNKNLLDRLTQTEIADMINVSQAQVSKVKRELEKEGEL